MLVLDTNVISELMRPEPEHQVVEWVASHPSGSLFTTTLTETELRYSVALLPRGHRRERLTAALEAMFAEDFSGRILPFDRAAARACAEIMAGRRLVGHAAS